MLFKSSYTKQITSLALASTIFTMSIGSSTPGLCKAESDKAPISQAQDITFKKQYGSTSPFTLVVIKYPSKINSENNDKIKNAFQNTFCYSKSACVKLKEKKLDAYIQDTLIKSSYYAQEYYHFLSKQLPASSIILQPQEITISPNGDIIYAEGVELPPSILTIDFNVLVSGNFYIDGGYGRNGYETRGNRLAANPVIYYSDDFGPEHKPLAGSSVTMVNKSTNKTYYGDTLLSKLNAYPSPKFINLPETSIYSELPINLDKELIYNTKRTGFLAGDRQRLEALVNTQGGDIDNPLFKEQWNFYTNVVVDILNNTDFEKIQTKKFNQYAKLYRTAGASDSSNNQNDIALIQQFLNSEKSFISEQDQKFNSYLYNGEFGDTYRKVQSAELKQMDKQHKVYVGSVLATYALAGATMGLAAGAGSAASALIQTGTTASYGIMMAASSAQSKIATAFDKQFSRILDAQTEVVINTKDGDLKIKGTSIEDFRKQFKKYYDQKFGTMASVGTR